MASLVMGAPTIMNNLKMEKRKLKVNFFTSRCCVRQEALRVKGLKISELMEGLQLPFTIASL